MEPPLLAPFIICFFDLLIKAVILNNQFISLQFRLIYLTFQFIFNMHQAPLSTILIIHVIPSEFRIVHFIFKFLNLN